MIKKRRLSRLVYSSQSLLGVMLQEVLPQRHDFLQISPTNVDMCDQTSQRTGAEDHAAFAHPRAKLGGQLGRLLDI
ncbi:hypothetical protein ACVW2A_003187 [Ewingella americana]